MSKNLQRPEFIEEARSLLRQCHVGSLATLREGAPFTTLVTLANDIDGSPFFLFSTLSAHTKNLNENPRASLLLIRQGKGDPLAHPRLTVNGSIAKTDAPNLRELFLKSNPKSALYVDFADFGFYKMTVTGFHLNGGFARAADFEAAEILG